jgi:hypothetical protein
LHKWRRAVKKTRYGNKARKGKKVETSLRGYQKNGKDCEATVNRAFFPVDKAVESVYNSLQTLFGAAFMSNQQQAEKRKRTVIYCPAGEKPADTFRFCASITGIMPCGRAAPGS